MYAVERDIAVIIIETCVVRDRHLIKPRVSMLFPSPGATQNHWTNTVFFFAGIIGYTAKERETVGWIV